MNYSEKLKDPRWQKKRLEVMQRDGFSCQLCLDKETTLHVHHDKYENDPWDIDIESLRTLCKHCHAIVEYLVDKEKRELKYVFKVWNHQDLFHIAAIMKRIDRYAIGFFSFDNSAEKLEPIYFVSPAIIYKTNDFLKELKTKSVVSLAENLPI